MDSYEEKFYKDVMGWFRDLKQEQLIQVDVQRALTEAIQKLTSEFNQFRHIANMKLDAVSDKQLAEIAELKEEVAQQN